MTPQNNYFKHFLRKIGCIFAIFAYVSHYLLTLSFPSKYLNCTFFMVFDLKNKILSLFKGSKAQFILKSAIRIFFWYFCLCLPLPVNCKFPLKIPKLHLPMVFDLKIRFCPYLNYQRPYSSSKV